MATKQAPPKNRMLRLLKKYPHGSLFVESYNDTKTQRTHWRFKFEYTDGQPPIHSHWETAGLYQADNRAKFFMYFYESAFGVR